MTDKNTDKEFKLHPLGSVVLLKEIKTETKTNSGIIISTHSETEEGKGIVISKGNDCKIDIIKDDIVLFTRYSGKKVHYEDENYFFVEEKDIFGYIDK